MDLFSLGIKADTRDLKRGKSELDAFARTGEKTEKRINKSMGRVEKGFRSVGAAAGGLKTVLATVASAAVVRQIANTTLEFQRIERSLNFATGSALGGAKAFGFVAAESNRLGLNLRASAGEFAKLSAAARGTALEGAEAQRIFTGVASASSALGLSADQTRGALNAVQQMISKGNVQAEELRGQLGERLPGAFQLAAKAMGVTTVQLNKMLEQGEVAATDLLPKLAKTLREDFGDAAEEAAGSAFGAFNRLSNSLDTLQFSIGESGLVDFLADVARFASDGVTALRFFGEQLGILDTQYKSLMHDGAAARLVAARDEIIELQSAIEQLEGQKGRRGAGARSVALAGLRAELDEAEKHAKQLQDRIDLLNSPTKGAGGRSLTVKGQTPKDQERAEKALEFYRRQIELTRELKNVEEARNQARLESKNFTDGQIKEIQQLQEMIDAQKFTIELGLTFDDKALKELGSEFKALDKIGAAFDGLGEQGTEAIERIIDASKAFKAASLDDTDAAFGAYAQGTASALMAVQSFTEEGSDEYKKLGVAIQAIQTAQAIAAIINQGSSGDPYTAFGRMAAMAAAVASLGVSVAGTFGGDSGSYDLAAVQTAQGTGSVLGDAAAKSESIANAIEAMEKNSDIEVSTSAKMLRELQDLNMNISGLGTLLARQFGDFTLNDPNVTGFNKGNLFSDANSSFQGALSKVIDAGGIFDLFGIGGMLNDLAGDILGSVLDGLFGKTTASVVDSGIAIQSQNLGELMADGLTGATLEAMQFANVQIKKKTWFSSSTSHQRQTQELGDNVERQLGLVVGGLYNSVLMGAEAAFGIDASSALGGVNLDAIDISLRGLSGDERTEALAAVFGKMGDQMAAVVPRVDEFQIAGEGLFETLTRVAADVLRAEYQLEQFGLTVGDVYAVAGQADVALELIRDALVANAGAAAGLIDNFAGAEDELLEFADRIFDLQTTFGLMGLNVDALTESMIRGARGSENLASGVDAYIGGFLTDGEQLGIKRGQLTAELAQSGIDLPATREAYRALLEGLDVSTDEGQRLAGALFASAEAADSLYSTIEESQQAQLEIVASLRSLVSSAQSIYSPSNLSSLQQSFFATANKARSGDLSSAESLVGIGQNVLSAAANQARSKYEYERIAATVAGTANSIANMFDIPTEVDLLERQLGVLEEIRDGSPEFGDSGEASVNRVDAIETKLAELSEELRSGFFAVAKNTQKTAKLLDRWDGDGMPEERVA